MVERITSRRSTLRTLPALREEALPRPRAQRMCRGVHTESSADRSEMGQIDRSRRRRGCAGALRHKICTASLDNRPLIDGFVLHKEGGMVQKQVTAHGWLGSTPEGRRPNIDPEQVRKLACWGLTQNDRASFAGWSPQPSAVGPVPHQPGFLIVL